jgi:hypothetical protein
VERRHLRGNPIPMNKSLGTCKEEERDDVLRMYSWSTRDVLKSNSKLRMTFTVVYQGVKGEVQKILKNIIETGIFSGLIVFYLRDKGLLYYV